MKTVRRRFYFFSSVFFFILLLLSCEAGNNGGDGYSVDGDTDGGDEADLCDAVLFGKMKEKIELAESYFADGIFSTAHDFYNDALDLIDEPDMCEPSDNEGELYRMELKARYGWALNRLLIPLPLVSSFLTTGLPELKRKKAGANSERGGASPQEMPDGTTENPLSLVTGFIMEEFLPPIEEAIGNLELVVAEPEFSYRLPPFSITLSGLHITMPDETVDGFGEHDLGEAYALLAAYRIIAAGMNLILALDLNIDAPRIDDLMAALGGDNWGKELFDPNPHFLRVNEPVFNGIDGEEKLDIASSYLRGGIMAFFDDDDGDELFDIHSDPTGEIGDDVLDVIALESDSQEDDIIRRLGDGLKLNVRVHSINQESGEAEDITSNINVTFSLVLALLDSGLDLDISRAIFGAHPPEEDLLAGSPNGVDDDDDCFPDDGPLDLNLILSLFTQKIDFPEGAGFGICLNAFYDNKPDPRDLIPRWDADLGNPDYVGFVVDQSEDFTDLDGDGKWDEDEPLTDASHSYGDFSFEADGAFQSHYFYWPDPTWDGMFVFLGDWGEGTENDHFNRVVSALIPLLFPEEGGGR